MPNFLLSCFEFVYSSFLISSSDPDDEHESDDESQFCPVTDVVESIMPAVSKDSSSTTSVSFDCGCKLNQGLPCSTAFDPEDLVDARMQYCQPWMSKEERDIAVLAKIESGIHLDDQTLGWKKKRADRKVSRVEYLFRGRPLCLKNFLTLHNIGESQYYKLKKHYITNGVESRTHGSTKKSPRNALAYSDIQNIVQFIVNYAETHAITLPGRTPRHWKADTALLPTSTTKRVVYDAYKKVKIFF